MNNKIFIAIILIIISGIGGYYLLSKPVEQSHRSYEMEVTSKPSNIDPKKPATFRYKIKNDKGEVLKNYEVAHEKIMHFITVRKDLAYFQHLHPDFNEVTSEFTVVVTFPEVGPYRLFPDFTPGDDNPQKLPVTVQHDINVGSLNKYYAQSVVQDREQTKIYGDYKITTTFPKDAKKQTEITYSLSISQNGRPVTNLEKYLGALGHSVIIKEGSLDFIHTHAEDMAMMDHQGMSQEMMMGMTGPYISFSTTFPASGVYKIFTQFQHQGKVLTTDYTVRLE